MGKNIDFSSIEQSGFINEQLTVGNADNKYSNDKSVCKLAPASKRVDQMINHMFSGSSLVDPVVSQSRLQEASNYSHRRQARYFGAWALDQADHFVKKMKQMPIRLEESQIREHKQEFIAALHQDFESGEAMKYVDEWYASFPKGGYFNPARYEQLYEDEKEIASVVAEYMLCGYGRPAIAGLLNYGKHPSFNHAFVDTGGAFLIMYKTGSGIQDMLSTQAVEISDHVSETIGEDEAYIGKQRVFITDECDYGNGLSGCAVLYAGFDTMANVALTTHVRNAVASALPSEVWKASNELMIASKPFKVSVGEIDMAKKYLKAKPTETVPSIKKTMDMNVQPDDSLDAKAYRDKMLSQEEPDDEDYYFM